MRNNLILNRQHTKVETLKKDIIQEMNEANDPLFDDLMDPKESPIPSPSKSQNPFSYPPFCDSQLKENAINISSESPAPLLDSPHLHFPEFGSNLDTNHHKLLA